MPILITAQRLEFLAQDVVSPDSCIEGIFRHFLPTPQGYGFTVLVRSGGEIVPLLHTSTAE